MVRPRRVQLGDDQKQIAASLHWLLKGDAAQRAIAAWHFGWGPARQTAEPAWAVPFLAQLLIDPYAVVHHIAEDALKKLPGRQPISYDFLLQPSRSRGEAQRVIRRWQQAQRQRKRLIADADSLLMFPDGQLDAERIRRLIQQRDNRPVVIKE